MHGAHKLDFYEGTQSYPFTEADVGALKVGYLALGHYHNFGSVGSGPAYYSGSPEGLCFDEPGGRSVLLVELGSAVLRVNTRGHDGISTTVTSSGGRRAGAAYESVDDCRHDLAAWIHWLERRGSNRIGLVGHSLGAVKCIYSLVSEPAPSVSHLVALSPPRLSYSHFARSVAGPQFLAVFEKARNLIDQARGAELLDVGFPLPYVVSAAGYVDKYGPDERFNFLKYIPSLPCLALFLFGALEVEQNLAFQGLPELVQRGAPAPPRCAVEVIPDADHFYTGVRKEMMTRIEAWLSSS